jgi:hypothetical protein
MNPTATFANPGNYNVVMNTTSLQGCLRSDTLSISVLPAPVFAIQGQGTNGAVGCGTFSFGDTVNTGTNNGVSLNQWAHVVLSRASTASNDAFIYINSTLKATGTLSTNYSGTHGVGIGYTPTAGEYFSGTIAIVRIYKGYALSSGDVLQNYNLTKTRFGL